MSIECLLRRLRRRKQRGLLLGRVACFLACSLFCVLDILHNLLYFLRRPFTVNTHLDYGEPLQLPSVTICIPNIVDLPLLQRFHPAVYAKYRQVSWDKYYWRQRFAAELTIGQLRLVEPRYGELFVDCSVLTNRLDPVRCERLAAVQHFFSMAKHCYSFFEQNPRLRDPASEYRYGPVGQQVSDQKSMRLGNPEENMTNQTLGLPVVLGLSNASSSDSVGNKLNFNASVAYADELRFSPLHESRFTYTNELIRNRNWIRLTVDRSKLWNQWLDVIISDRGRQFEMFNGQPGFLTFSTEISNYAEFDYEQTLVQRLPRPFESDCVDYPAEFGCLDRAHCVDSCLGRLSLQRRRRWPFHLETIEPQFKLDAYHFEPSDAYSRIRSECSQSFPRPDCQSTQHVAYLSRLEMCEPQDVQPAPIDADGDSAEARPDGVQLEPDSPPEWNATEVPDDLPSVREDVPTALTAQGDLWPSDAAQVESELEPVDGPDEWPADGPEPADGDPEPSQPPTEPVSTDCSSEKVTLVIKYSSEFATRMVYVPIFDSMQLVNNVGQAVSVYLGVCLYDLHRLLSLHAGCLHARWRARRPPGRQRP